MPGVAIEDATSPDVGVARIGALATVDHKADQDDDRTNQVLPATEESDEVFHFNELKGCLQDTKRYQKSRIERIQNCH